MSETINPELYKYVSDKYGLVYRSVQNSFTYLDDAVIHIARMNNVEAKLDLMRSFRSCCNEFEQNKFIPNLYSAASAINNHVINRAGFSDINDWLSSNNIKVIQEWASLCSKIGFTIESSNIED